MANLTKRIIDLQTTSTLGSDDYVMVDGATNGTKKYLLKDVLDEIEDVKDGTGLATGAVTTDKLAAGAVTNAKIGDGAVDTTNIADDAVTAAKIDDGAVGTDALAANAVTGAKIATGAVGTGNIASGAVTLDKIASDSNATSSRNGLMSSADKAKLDGFSAASNYALKSDIVGAYIFKGSVNTENDLPSTGLTVGDVYNIIAASSYGESGANVAWTGTAWDALGESFDISDGAIDTEQLANGAVTNDKLATEAMTTVSPTTVAYDDPTYGSGTRQGYDATFGNSHQTIRLPKVSSGLLIDVENIPTIPEKKIGYGAITANKIAAGAVGTEKLANSAVNTDKLATAAVSTDKIASLAVTTNKIAAGAVGTAQIANGAVTSEKLGSDVTTALNSKAAASDVTALQEYVDEELEYKADIDGYYSQLTAGLAENLIGADDTEQWATRESTGSGAATVRSVQGASEVQDSVLVPVQIAGIKSVGFNQWDEEWEQGYLNVTSGAPYPSTNAIRSKNYCRIIPDQTYYLTCSRDDGGSQNRFYAAILFYDESKAFVSYAYRNRQTFTVPSNAAYFKLCTNTSTVVYGGTYTHDICVNLSDPARNGEYKPYMSDAIEWPTQTLRAAGSVRDELTASELVTRVGVVDLGTLDWSYYGEGGYFRTVPYSWLRKYDQTSADIQVAGYPSVTRATGLDKGAAISDFRRFIIKDTSFGGDVNAFKAGMSGVLCFYPVATPTTTTITPALPMTYRVEQGGTEAIIVPTGEISAAPVLTVAEGERAADVVMDALACIATPDGPTATSSHAVNTYLTMQGKLYKVTSAIAVGETIKSGTNVSQTTVMAELIARTA